MKKQLTEHQKYIAKYKQDKVIITGCRIAILLLFIAVWQLFSSLNIIDGFLFSSPSRIAVTIKNLYISGDLFKHVATTVFETITGFIIASALGTIIAVCMWWSQKLRAVLEPYVVVLNSLPKIALGPLIIIWFGAGTKSIVFMAVLITIIVTIINMLAGFIQTDESKILLLKSMGATKMQIFAKLVFPSSIPTLISTLKINVGMAWIGSIMGEYLVSKQGLGYLIVYGGQVFKLDLVMASTVILCLLAGFMYFAVALFEKKMIKWK